MVTRALFTKNKFELSARGNKKVVLFSLLSLLLSYSLYSQHFNPVWGDQNPLTWMNVIVTNASIEGVNVASGDEIAVFDVNGSNEEICVGATILSSDTGPFFINAGMDQGNGGFTTGHSILFKIWDASEAVEMQLVNAVFDLTPPLVDVYTPNGVASASISGFLYYTWTGANDADWNTSDNWNTNLVPDQVSDVIIPASGISSYPVLSSSSTGDCKNIILEATSTNQASILGNQYLDVSGIAKVQSFISADQWHIVSPPVENTNVGFYSLGEDPKVYLTKYEEEAETYVYLTDPSSTLNEMQGYMLWVCDSDHTYEYTGNMNYGTFGFTDNLSRNNSGSGNEGWNLVGNPYPSSIDWEASSGWIKSANLGNAIYLYNNGVWEYYLDDSPSGHSTNGTRYIAPGQGFFVRVLSGLTGTLIMDDNVRVNNETQFFKSSEKVNSYVKLSVTGDSNKDETIVRFIESATDDFDGQFDVFKKFSTIEEYCQVFTKSDVQYYINSMVTIDQVPIGFYAGINGEYTLALEEIENIGNIWLEDLHTGSYFDLTKDDYRFNYNTIDEPDRFILHFTPVSIQEDLPENVNIYTFNKKIYLRSSEQIKGMLTVHNLLGQKVVTDDIESETAMIALDKDGFYLVSLITEYRVVAKKVFAK